MKFAIALSSFWLVVASGYEVVEKSAVCNLVRLKSGGEVTDEGIGAVTFSQSQGQLQLTAEINSGLEDIKVGEDHGFHVHSGTSCKAPQSHFNPHNVRITYSILTRYFLCYSLKKINRWRSQFNSSGPTRFLKSVFYLWQLYTIRTGTAETKVLLHPDGFTNWWPCDLHNSIINCIADLYGFFRTE